MSSNQLFFDSIASSPGEVALTAYDKHWRFLQYELALEDTTGALAARQWGTVVLAARQSLRLGIDWFLAGTLSNTTPERRYDNLIQVVGEDCHIFRQAWTLECANPISQQQVGQYLQECISFVQDDLQLKSPFWPLHSAEDFAAGRAHLLQIVLLLTHLEIPHRWSGTILERNARQLLAQPL